MWVLWFKNIKVIISFNLYHYKHKKLNKKNHWRGQGREKVLNALRNVISERKKEKRIVKEDFLDQVLEKTVEDKEHFNDEVVLDYLFSSLFAGYDATSVAMTMAVKYLTETPRALNELRVTGDFLLGSAVFSSSCL